MNSTYRAETSSEGFQPHEEKINLKIINRKRLPGANRTYRPPGGTAQRIGILSSLVLHASVLFLVGVVMPPAPIIPAVKTFYIRFAESPVASTGGQDHVNREARPRALSVKRASRKETVPQERPQPLTEANPIATEKPAVTVNQEALGSVLPAVEPSGPLAGIVAGTAAAKGGGEVVAQTVFGEVGAPTFIHREIPAYPLMARRFGKEGKVILRLRINAKGNLQHIDVIEPSGFGFTEAAIEAVRKSTFSPARRGGSPVASEAILAVRFVLM